MSTLDNKRSFVHLLGGATSGMVACIALQPLDLIKTRLQQHRHTLPRHTIYSTIKDIIHTNRVHGLWRGTVPTIVRNVPGSAMYFYALSEIRGVWKPQRKLDNLLAGAVARGSVAFVMMPITVVKVRYEVKGN